MANRGKKLRDHYKNTDRDRLFNLSEAVKLVRELLLAESQTRR